MTLGYKARALNRGLSREGEPALLRGSPAGKVNVARNVQLFAGQLGTADDNSHVRYTVATISNDYSPRTGDLLQIVDAAGDPLPGRSYVLDRLAVDNGVTSRYIVAEA